MMTRVTIDIETDNPKIAAQRSPADDKRRDRRRLQRAILGRYGTHAPKDAIKTTHVRPDGVKQVARRLTTKRIRAAGRMIGRWWLRYSRGWQQWMQDRVDVDDTNKGD